MHTAYKQFAMKHTSWIILLFNMVYLGSIYGQCSIQAQFPIEDLTPISANLIVDGAINNDLSTTGQSVCGLQIEFEHEQVGDLEIELTSPGGQSVVLVGPNGSFGNTAFTDWDILFVPCSNNASPDAGFQEQWNSNQNWGILGDYSGSYHPYLGCLEDFDFGQVNGNWNLTIRDNSLFDTGLLKNATIFFCDPSGLSCNMCIADAGEFQTTELSICASSTENLDIPPLFINGSPGSEYEFYYIIRQGDNILDIVNIPNLTGYDEGIYQVCGFSILSSDAEAIPTIISNGYSSLINDLQSSTPSFCADLNEECVTVNFAQEPIEIDLDVTICEGESFELGEEIFTISDSYVVTIPQSSGCDSVYNLELSTVELTPIIENSANTLSCDNPNILLEGSSSMVTSTTEFIWTRNGNPVMGDNSLQNISINESGTYTLTLKDGLCEVSTSVQIFANADAPDLSVSGGTITCDNPTVNIDLESSESLNSISWEGPNSFSSNNEDITVDVPGLYIATVIASNGCEAVKSIFVNEAGEEPVLLLLAEDLSCGNPQVPIIVSSSTNNLTYSWTGPNSYQSNQKSPIITQPGNYMVVATDPFGCSSTYQIEIGGDPSELNYDLIVNDITCPSSGSDLSLDIDDPNAIVTWTLPNNSTLTGDNITANTPGLYEVEIFSEGCTKNETFSIIEDFSEVPVAEIIQDAVIGCDSSSATLSINILANGDKIDRIEWYGPTGFIDNSTEILAEYNGQYAVFIYDLDNCPVRLNHTLTYQASIPTAGIIQKNLTCIDTIPSLTAFSSQSLNYFWEGPNGFISTDSTIADLEFGIYELTVSDSNNCARKYGLILRADTLANPLITSGDGLISCINTSSVVQIINTSLYNAFDWTGPNGFNDTLATTEANEPGLYYIEAIDASSGCIAYDTIEVLIDTIPPLVSSSDTAFFCGQEDLILLSSTQEINLLYNWTGPNGFTSSFSSPLINEPGTYDLTVTGQNGCTSELSVLVDEDNTLPDVSASVSNNLDCVLTEATLTGASSTSQATFFWKGPDNVFDDPVISTSVPGDYVFIVTGPNGCSDSTTIELLFTGEIPEFTAVGDTLFCNETTSIIDINAITANVSYEWVGPNGFNSTNAMNMVVDSGLYIVTGTAQNNCVFQDSVYVIYDNQEAQLELLSSIDTLDCTLTSQNIDLETNRPLVSVMWNGPNSFTSDQLDVSVDEAGTYILTVVAENNCESTLVYEIEENIEDPVFSIEGEDLNCDNNKADITLSILDNGASFEWTGPAFSSNLQNPIVEIDGLYQVTVTGTNGCSSIGEIEIVDDFIEPDIQSKNDTLPCNDDPIMLTATSSMDSVSFQWLGPNGFDSTNPNALTDMPGIYFITATGANGCSTTESIEIFDVPIIPEFEIEKSNDLNCELQFSSISAIDVEDDESFTWTGPNGFISQDQDLNLELQDAGMYFLEVIGTTGCIKVDSVEVTVDTIIPNIELQQLGRLICDVNEVSINASGSSEGAEFTYDWTTNDGVIKFGQNSLNPIIEGEGTYNLRITNNNNGCFHEEEIRIEQEESTLESMDWTFDKQTCPDIPDGSITITNVEGGVAPFFYAIEGTSFSEISTFEGLLSGDYIISVKDSFGCVLDSLVTLEDKFAINVDLGDDLEIALGESVDISAQSNFPLGQISEIEWLPAEIADCDFCLNFSFVPNQNMQVTVLLTDNNGCTTSDQMIIRVNDEINLYVPNIFTPNNDGINDTWNISESKNIEKINYFNIYDRWGDKVYSETDFVPGFGSSWNGTHNGQSVKQGVYVYIAELVMVNGQKRIIKGNITVTR